MALSAAEHVDLVCVVVDLSRPDDKHAFEKVRTLDVGAVVVAANKCDLVSEQHTRTRLEQLGSGKIGPVRPVSALTGEGIEELRDAFADALGSAATTTLGESLLISERQRGAVRDASDALERAATADQPTEVGSLSDRLFERISRFFGSPGRRSA